MSSSPYIVAVVNITNDSFSDGGRYLAPADALAHARRLRHDGADIIELGPASSHPDAQQVTAEEERQRLAPVLPILVAEGMRVSVDSYLPETQRFAVAEGASYLNDIQGFPDPTFYPTLRDAECTLVVMHSIQRAGPATRTHTDPGHAWTSIEQFFTERLATLEAAGIPKDRLVIDPGLGFFLGSNAEPSIAVLGAIHHLKDRFGLPVLVSPSRKSFLQRLTGRDTHQVGPATLAAELHAARQGVDYIRTHDVRALRDALTVQAALAGPRPDNDRHSVAGTASPRQRDQVVDVDGSTEREVGRHPEARHRHHHVAHERPDDPVALGALGVD